MENKSAICENIFNREKPNLLDLVDGKLHTEDGYTFAIHKYELAKNSNYFYALFCGMEKDKDEFLIHGIRGEILGNVLCYIYTGNICLNQDNITDLLLASDYLLLDDLLQKIKIYARNNISISNCIAVFAASLCINQEDVTLNSFRFIQTHFEFLVKYDSSKIEELPFDVFKKLLYDKNLCVRDENTVWKAIMRWVNANETSRKIYVSWLLMCLKPADMDETLATAILGHNIVAMNEFCNDVNEARYVKSFNRKLDVFNYFIQMKQVPGLEISNNRHPSKIYLIGYYSVLDGQDSIQIYVTYDENIDLWRKILGAGIYPEFFIVVGQCIYIFDAYKDTNLVYNYIQQQLVEIDDWSTIMRYDYFIVKHEELIYKLGGVSDLFHLDIYDVEVYNPQENEWRPVSPMIPVTCVIAASMGGKIYVVGNISENQEIGMIAQEYDTVLDAWTLLPPPITFRYDFALMGYRNKLYLIGGTDEDIHLKNVEVYDPDQRSWMIIESLPNSYYHPTATIMNEKLIVHEGNNSDRCYLKSYPPVQWNDHFQVWEAFDDVSPLTELHMYFFLTTEDSNCLSMVTKQNREMVTYFEKSPFNNL